MLNELSGPEVDMMTVFWDSEFPLARQQMIDRLDEKKIAWKASSYVSPLLKGLLDKNYIEVVGKIRSGKRFSRLFSPVLTREDYQRFLFGKFFRDKEPSAHLIAGLVSVQENKSEYVEALYKQVEDIREKMLGSAGE